MRSFWVVVLLLRCVDAESRAKVPDPSADLNNEPCCPKKRSSDDDLNYCYFDLSYSDHAMTYDPEMLCMGDTEVDVDVANKVVAKCAEMNDITEDVKYGIVWKKGPKFFPPIHNFTARSVVTGYYYACCHGCTQLVDRTAEFKSEFIANSLRQLFPVEVDRRNFKGDYFEWRDQHTCPGALDRDVVIKEDEKDEGCMIHLDTYSELQAYFGPLRYYQLSQSIAYIGPDMITEKHGCMYGMTRSGYEMNCHCDASRRRDCAVFHEADDIICAQRDKLDDIGPALSFDLSNLRSAKNCIFWVYGRMQIVDGRSKLSFMTALRPDTNNACNNVYAKMKENMKCIVKDMVADSSLCPFQSDQSRPEIHYAEVICCCGPKDGSDQTLYHLCNYRLVSHFTH